jgi:hypothetical protein
MNLHEVRIFQFPVRGIIYLGKREAIDTEQLMKSLFLDLCLWKPVFLYNSATRYAWSIKSFVVCYETFLQNIGYKVKRIWDAMSMHIADFQRIFMALGIERPHENLPDEYNFVCIGLTAYKHKPKLHEAHSNRKTSHCTNIQCVYKYNTLRNMYEYAR